MQTLNRTSIVLAMIFCCAGSALAGPKAAAPESQAMIFLPPGAAYCRDFLHLEVMAKYDKSALPIPENEALDYFTYRGIEEWIRGFVTATNILNAKTGAGDLTKSNDIYDLMPRFFEYCRSHRDEIFSDAVVKVLYPPAAASQND